MLESMNHFQSVLSDVDAVEVDRETNSHDVFTGSESGSSNSLQDLAASTTPSVETGTPTVPIPGAGNNKQETDKEDIATGQSTHCLLEMTKQCLLGAHSLKF